jgi:hypothetical protein
MDARRQAFKLIDKLKLYFVKSERITRALALEIDLVDFLAELGHHPTKVRNHDFWYLSPIRKEKHSSFKINRKLNKWFDHGIGIGGNLIDFGMLFFACSQQELFYRIAHTSRMIPFNNQPVLLTKKIAVEKQKIIISAIREIEDPLIRQYLKQRRIPLLIARRFCCEIAFKLYGKKQIVLGFKNNDGGYELRNPYFKGGNSPKGITLFTTGSKSLCVFEGFFDFLSFNTQALAGWEILLNPPCCKDDFLVLNSLAFFEKSRILMEKYGQIRLYLDRDPSGIRWTDRALSWSDKYVDESKEYCKFKDLNDFLVRSETAETQV